MRTAYNYIFEYFAFSGKYQINNTVTKSLPFESSINYKVFMETSFEDNAAEDHAKAIWTSSIIFLKNSLKNEFNEYKGFNDEQIFDTDLTIKDYMSEKMHIFYTISRNSILSYRYKNIFNEGLKHEKDLKVLLYKLSELYCEYIFEYIIVVFYEAWEKFLLFKQTTKLSEELAKFLAPSFTNISTNLDEISNYKQYEVYLPETDEIVVSKADDAGYEISGCYFISTKMRFLNLKYAETLSNRSNFIRKYFETFVQVMTRAVFLCSFGCYFHPNGYGEPFSLTTSESFAISDKSCDFSYNEIKPCRKRRKN